MFKKRNTNPTSHCQSIFPDAKELIIKSSEYCDEITAQEILDGILEASRKGKRKAFFFSSTISEHILKELEQQGYTVESSVTYDGSPCITISW